MVPRSMLGPMLGQASHLFRERGDARMAKYGVTPAQAHFILYLSRCGGQVSQRALGEHMRVKPSTVNGILDRLVERGLVLRSTDVTDARCKCVALTEKGTATLEQFHQDMQNLEGTFNAVLSDDEQAQLRDFLSRLIRFLEEDRAKC